MNIQPFIPSSHDVGLRIRHLRRRLHLTQLELARRVGIRPGPMNNIEQGRNLPSTPVALALAHELGVSLDELLKPAVEHLTVREESCSKYRTHADLGLASETKLFRPAEVSDLVLDRIGMVADAYLALEDLCQAHKQAQVPLALPFHWSQEGIDDLVRRVRSHLEMGQSIVFDYLELFENAGLRVVFIALPAGCHSIGAFDRDNGNLFIFINPNLNPERQIFRLVYELGWAYVWLADPVGELTRDRAARRFAAVFLMPAAAVRQTVAQLGIKSSDWTYELMLRIKHRFGVSAESFIIRLEELALIEVPLAESFKTRIRAHYQKTNYSEPDNSRRILSPNGRIGDLVQVARAFEAKPGEATEILEMLCRKNICIQ